MAQKDLVVRFGSGDPASFGGLTPTFVNFFTTSGTTVSPPSISEIIANSGFYKFTFGYTLTPIVFKIDGGAALSDSDRYVAGTLDPIQVVDQRVGFETDSFGSTSADPSTVLGLLKRNQEYEEGNAVYIKSTGLWYIYSRGSSTLLVVKTLANNTTQATKV